MPDRISIGKIGVIVERPHDFVKGRLLQRASVMEREAEYLALSARQIRDGLQLNQQRLLAEGVLNSRNWMLSVVMSHCFLQWALEPPISTPAKPTGAAQKHEDRFWFVEQFLVDRAVRAGKQDGEALRF